MSNTIQINSADFKAQVLDSDVPVLVDFWAAWCGPCKMLTPVIEELAAEFAGKAKITKVNVDDNQDLAQRFGIRGIPTVMVFKDGEATASLVGLRSKQELAAALNEAL